MLYEVITGHRFHAPGPIDIASPAAYLETLETKGRVIADFERRRVITSYSIHYTKLYDG